MLLIIILRGTAGMGWCWQPTIAVALITGWRALEQFDTAHCAEGHISRARASWSMLSIMLLITASRFMPYCRFCDKRLKSTPGRYHTDQLR